MNLYFRSSRITDIVEEQMNTKKRHKRVCYFCPNPIEPGDKAKYIYPLPSRYKAHVHEGACACMNCAPGIIAELKAEGQLIQEHKTK